MNLKSFACLASGILLSLTSAHGQGAPVLTDPINYSSWSTAPTPMNAKWTLKSGSAPTIVAQHPTSTVSSAGRVSNSVLGRDLPPLTNDWEVSIDLLHTAWQRGLWVALADGNGRGYGFMWNSASNGTPPQFNSQGYVKILRLKPNTESEIVHNFYSNTALCEDLTSATGSGHNAGNVVNACMTPPYAKMKLTWTRAGVLKLFVNGVEKGSVTNTTYTSFNRVYVGGGSGGQFDNLRVALSGGSIDPWTLYEAEDGQWNTGASLVTGALWTEPAYEARGKKMVELNASGEYVEWQNVVAANYLTVRYTIDDNTTDTLRVFVNGAEVTSPTFPLTYTRIRETKPTNQMPGGIVRFFDEVTREINIPANSTIRLQHGSGSARYAIDFIEVESKPAALLQPPNTPTETWTVCNGFDRAAVVAAISAASSNKRIWFPTGTYTISSSINVPSGYKFRGAGPHYTRFVKNFGGSNVRLFNINISGSTGNEFQDFSVEDTITTLEGNPGNTAIYGSDTVNLKITNVFTHWASLVIAYRAMNVQVKNCRMRNAYKDAIHIAQSANNCLVENCSFRNIGDDGVGFVNYGANPGLSNNTARYNTFECTYWGRGISVFGGDGTLVEYNVMTDCAKEGIRASMEGWDGTNWPYLTNFNVRFNTLIRCGNQHRNGSNRGTSLGVLGLVNNPMAGKVERNYVLEPPFHGSQLTRYVGQAALGNQVTFINNTIAKSTSPVAPNSYIFNDLDPGHNCVFSPNTLLP